MIHLEYMKCTYCGLELEPCRLPFCTLEHAAWHFWGKPPLARDPMEDLYGGRQREVRYLFYGLPRRRLERLALPEPEKDKPATGNVLDAPGMELYRP